MAEHTAGGVLAPHARPARARGGRGLVRVLLVLLLLAGLLVVADRVAALVTASRVASEIQGQLGTPDRPRVSIGGFPFLTQAATGRFSSMHVAMDEVTLPNASGLKVTGVDSTLTGLTATNGYSRVVADHAEATGLLSYEAVSKLTGLDLAYDSPDRVRLNFEVNLGGAGIKGTATGRPVLDVENQTLQIEDAKFSVVSGNVPQTLVDAAGRLALRSVALNDLPYRLRLTAIAVQPDGVQVTGTGEDLPLRG